MNFLDNAYTDLNNLVNINADTAEIVDLNISGSLTGNLENIRGPTGMTGATGPRGPKGEADDGGGEIEGVGEVFAVIAGVLTGTGVMVTVWGSIQAQIAYCKAQIAALWTFVGVLQGEVTAVAAHSALIDADLGFVQGQLVVLEEKTFFQAVIGVETVFTTPIVTPSITTSYITPEIIPGLPTTPLVIGNPDQFGEVVINGYVTMPFMNIKFVDGFIKQF